MNRKLLFRKFGLAMLLGTAGLFGVLPLRAQDNAKEKKDEPVVLEQPAESPVTANASDDEDKGHVWHGGRDVVIVGNDFVLKEDEDAADVVVVFGNATIKGRV